MSEDAVRYSKEILGVDAKSGDFLTDRSIEDGSVDAVAMWDVAEHVDAPGRFVERAAELLRPDGYLFITTGDIDAWLPRRQGPRWRLIHPPTHLQYFSQITMTRMLENRGFDVVSVSHPGYWRSVRQILHGLFVFGKSHEPSAAYKILNQLLPKKLGVYMNTFDIMYVVARKRGS
jgi:SAM-dependent methyltransferase